MRRSVAVFIIKPSDCVLFRICINSLMDYYHFCEDHGELLHDIQADLPFIQWNEFRWFREFFLHQYHNYYGVLRSTFMLHKPLPCKKFIEQLTQRQQCSSSTADWLTERIKKRSPVTLTATDLLGWNGPTLFACAAIDDNNCHCTPP